MEQILQKTFFVAIGSVVGYIASLFGGCNALLVALIIVMACDYISGLMVAGVFKNSPKTTNGALESHASFKGLCRKGMILFMVLIAVCLDNALGTNFIRNAVIIAYTANELLSIIENFGLMGVYIPPAIGKAVEVLKNKGDNIENK